MNRLIIVFLLLLEVSSVFGQTRRDEPPKIPTLNGHRFLDNRLVFNSWSNSSFKLYVGYGDSQRLPLQSLDLGDTVLTTSNGSLAFATLGVNYEQRIKDWLSFYLSVGGTARVGLETRGLLTQGLNTYIGYQLGWKIKIWENERNRLAGRLGIYNYEANFINVLQYVLDVINNNPNASVSQDVPALQTFMGLMYAHSFGPLIGIQAEATLGIGDSFIRDDESTDVTYGLGIAADLNLYPKTKVPLGLSLGYSLNSTPEVNLESSSVTSIFSYQLAYTGTSDFIISLDFTSFKLPVVLGADLNKIGEVKTDNVTLNVTYYFNGN